MAGHRGLTAGHLPRGRGGVALMMVVWVLTALAIIFSEFVYASRVSLNAVRNQRNDAVGYYLALGACYLALDEIRQPYLYLASGGEEGVVFVEKTAGEASEPAPPLRSGELPGTGKYFYRITDEESKMNVNRITDRDRGKLVEFFRAVGVEMGEERDTIIDSILDWMDADKLHRLNGAEDDYYRSLTPPYYAKNGKFTTVTELLLVKGMTAELFYGALPGEGEAAGEPRGSLADAITVWGESINLNTAPREVLSAWYPEATVERILRERPYPRLMAMEAGALPATVKSSYFTIVAEGKAEGARTGRGIRLVVNRREAAGKVAAAAVIQWDDSWTPPAEEVPDAR